MDSSTGKFFPIPFWNLNFYGLVSLNMKIFLHFGEVEAGRHFGTNTFGHLFSGLVKMQFLKTAGICQLYDLSVF